MLVNTFKMECPQNLIETSDFNIEGEFVNPSLRKLIQKTEPDYLTKKQLQSNDLHVFLNLMLGIFAEELTITELIDNF